MTFGAKLKQLRQQKGLSQPELALEAGIEQSYLSKLENDKSIPSNEVFRKLLSTFNISISDVLDDKIDKTELERLKQIPDIESYINQQNEQRFSLRRRYLIFSSALIVIAVTLFYVGFSKAIFSEKVYTYYSLGVVKPSEPENVFSRWSVQVAPRSAFKNDAEWEKVHHKRKIEMAVRRSIDTKLFNEYKGYRFSEKVPGGKRLYELASREDKNFVLVQRPINGWLQIVGVFLFAAGVMGFVLERALFK